MNVAPLAGLTPALYNPRRVDSERLDMVRLSLQKLGWLLPMYVTEDNEILSGHQRATVAVELGYTHAPVEVLHGLTHNQRRALNIMFNRATNDFAAPDTPTEVTRRLLAEDVSAVASGLPDWPLDNFPCIEAVEVPIAPLLAANRGRWVRYAYNVAKTLRKRGILMPIVVADDGRVVNGIGRLQMLAEEKETSVLVVTLDGGRADLAAKMLNLLSMDFDVEEKYGDYLRHNSFRRERHKRESLGRGVSYWVVGDNPSRNFSLDDPVFRAKWVKRHGMSVVDFGAGHLSDTQRLRAAGIDVAAFEPYRLAGGEIDKELSVETAREFLAAVASGQRFSSVFLSSVLNSVPFYADRVHIVKICSALVGGGALYATALHDQSSPVRAMQAGYLNASDVSGVKMFLDYESGITLGDPDRPKVQKYHSAQEFHELMRTAFEAASVTICGNNVHAVAVRPVGVVDGLRDALEFEFNLPYPDGSRMGLVDEAIAAFSERLEVSL